MDIKEGLRLQFKNFLIKNNSSGVNIKVKPVQRTYANNEKLAEELHKPIIKFF